MPGKPHRATLYHHPRSPVTLDDPYRATPESIARAKAEAAKERAEVDAALKQQDALRDVAKLTLVDMVDRFGWASVNLWMQGIRYSNPRHQ